MAFHSSGTLIIKPISGKLTRDTEFMGKMDPYCVCKVGAQTQRSREHTDAGKHPSWNDSLSFRRTGEHLLEIEVWDKDVVSKDDLVGSGSVALIEFFEKKQATQWVDLQYKGKKAGQVLISVEWLPDSNKNTNQSKTNVNQSAGVIPMSLPNQSYGFNQPYYPPPPQYGQTYNPPAYQGYPPQQPGYPPQQLGYPPQQPGYPPQQPGYPPQQPGYPPQQPGFPPQQPGYPPQQPPQQPGYPPQQPGYPPQQPPQQPGYPPQQPGYPPQQPPQQPGYPPQQPPQQAGQYGQTLPQQYPQGNNNQPPPGQYPQQYQTLNNQGQNPPNPYAQNPNKYPY